MISGQFFAQMRFCEKNSSAAGNKDQLFALAADSDDYAEVRPVPDGPFEAGAVTLTPPSEVATMTRALMATSL